MQHRPWKNPAQSRAGRSKAADDMMAKTTFYLIALFIALGGEHVELHTEHNNVRRVVAHRAR